MNFLLEIGTEEIPDWMIPGALEYLREKFPVAGASVATDATPRRLVVRASGLAEREADREEMVSGPPKSAAAGAVAGFAKKLGVAPEALTIAATPKGEYYTYTRKIEGRTTKVILASELAGYIAAIPWPKTMYWTGKNETRFIRPIRWIVALLGNGVVPFEIAGVRSGNESRGHRRLGKASFPVTFENYESELRANGVILSARERREKILSESRGDEDPKLLETLVYLTEFPTAIHGTFDAAFLDLPAEVLTTVMRSHQKYFSVTKDGKLQPEFYAVTNTNGDPQGLIRRGNERVLKARFNDARFFWDSDQRRKLEERVEDLKAVTFQAKLGSYYDKTQRVEGLVAILNGDDHALRAARLAKTDLTTELVKEFTELQGVVGGLYARAQGEPEDVALAIYDHYKPTSMEDAIPRTAAGRLVSIADKLDTLIGCFQIGLIPSGSKDPFALRRAAQGIVKIAVEGRMRIPLRSYVSKDPRLEEFFLDRVRYYFRDIRGFLYDEVNAALASGWDDLVNVEERLAAIQAVRPTENFEPLAASFKRIRNILKQANFTSAGDSIQPDLLEPGAERGLYEVFLATRERIRSNGTAYLAALQAIAALRPAVDSFFDKVMVNVPDERVRRNRLALLDSLLTEFSTIADFSEIVTTNQETKS